MTLPGKVMTQNAAPPGIIVLWYWDIKKGTTACLGKPYIEIFLWFYLCKFMRLLLLKLEEISAVEFGIVTPWAFIYL